MKWPQRGRWESMADKLNGKHTQPCGDERDGRHQQNNTYVLQAGPLPQRAGSLNTQTLAAMPAPAPGIPHGRSPQQSPSPGPQMTFADAIFGS